MIRRRAQHGRHLSVPPLLLLGHGDARAGCSGSRGCGCWQDPRSFAPRLRLFAILGGFLGSPDLLRDGRFLLLRARAYEIIPGADELDRHLQVALCTFLRVVHKKPPLAALGRRGEHEPLAKDPVLRVMKVEPARVHKVPSDQILAHEVPIPDRDLDLLTVEARVRHVLLDDEEVLVPHGCDRLVPDLRVPLLSERLDLDVRVARASQILGHEASRLEHVHAKLVLARLRLLELYLSHERLHRRADPRERRKARLLVILLLVATLVVEQRRLLAQQPSLEISIGRRSLRCCRAAPCTPESMVSLVAGRVLDRALEERCTLDERTHGRRDRKGERRLFLLRWELEREQLLRDVDTQPIGRLLAMLIVLRALLVGVREVLAQRPVRLVMHLIVLGLTSTTALGPGNP